MENFIQILLIIQTIIHVSYSQVPPSICSIVKPFELAEKNCGDFTEICVKKDDLYCNNFQAACQQCPPTNFTVSVLLQLKNQIKISDQRIATLKDILIAFLAVFVICAIIILILMFFANYESIVQYIREILKKSQSKRTGAEYSYELILNKKDERFQEIINKNNTKLIQYMKEIINEKDNTKLLHDLKEIINEKVARYKMRFQIANQFEETELFVSEFDNVIKLKKSICDRNMNMDDYKRMIMKYKGVTLDNNQYLLSCIDSTNIPIFCEFDNNIDFNSMIVIKLKCDNIYPEMLQIWKHQQIKDLKIIISELNKTNHKDLLIFYKSTQLDDDKTIDDYKIEENDYIIALNKFEEMQNISMKSIFTAKETISIEFSKFETVSEIINKSIQKIQHEMATNHFVIFLNKTVLQNDKLIYEYNIDSKSLVEFCYFKNVNEIYELNKTKDYNHIKMYEAKNKITKRPVLIKAYKREYMDIESDNNLSRVLREDLQIFQLTKSHPRFIQFFDIYLDKNLVYIELEDLGKKGLMKIFLSNRKENKISIYETSRWAYQMLEGLKYLHYHNIIMKDLNPMNIWIDSNSDIKLTSFNTTEYLNHLNDDNENNYIYGVSEYLPCILTYVAPEILESKPCKVSADVWSVGVIMIDIITVDVLYCGRSNSQVVELIKETRTIEYDKENKPKDLTDFIDCCVKGDPEERATIDELMKMEFIEKYLL